MWYQSPLIGPMGQGTPELQSVTAAHFLVSPLDFGPTRAAMFDSGSPQPHGIYNGFSLYSHSYTPHFPPPQYYPPPQHYPPPPPSPILQFPQFYTQMTTMTDSIHSVPQIHSPTPHTYNQSYPIHQLHHQFTSNSPESFSQPSVHFIPTKTTITPPIHQFVSLSQHNLPLGCVKLEEPLNSHTPSLTEMRPEPHFIVDRSPNEKLKSTKVKDKFKVMSRVTMKRERRLGFSHRKKFQFSPILNSLLQLSAISLASPPCVEACFQLEGQEDNGLVDDKVVGLLPGYGQLHKLSNVNSEFNVCKLFDKRSQLEGLLSERMLADAVVDWLLSKVLTLTSLSVNFQNWYPMLVGLLRDMIECCNEPYITAFNYLLNDKRKWEEWYPDDKIEKLTKIVEIMFEEFKSAILDCNYNNLFVTFGCLHKDLLHKLSNEKSEFNALQLFDKRLQLEGLYSEERIGDVVFGRLLESVIVPAGNKNSMDFFFEVFLSLLYTYHNWRAILNWFLAAVIQCSVDPYMFIDSILLGDIGGRVSLHFARIELFKKMLIKSYESSNDIVVDFLFLNFCIWLGRSLENSMHNETTSATFLYFLVVICVSLSGQPHYYLSSPCKLEGLIGGKKGQGYQAVIDISVLKLCLFHVVTSLLLELKTTLLDEDDEPKMWTKLFVLPNSSSNMQLLQYGSREIIPRKIMLEELQGCNSNCGKLAADNSQLMWPFNVVLKLPFEEKALAVVLQSKEQLTRIKTKLSDEDRAKPRYQRHDSISIAVSFGIAKLVFWLMNINTIWSAIVAHVQATMLDEDDSNHAGLDFTVSEFIIIKFNISLLHWKPGFVTTASIALYYGYYEHKSLKFGLGLGLKPAWILLDIYHTSVFRNYLVQLTGLAKDIQVLQEFEALNISLAHVPTDNSYLLWPFVLVTKLASEEIELTVGLQINEQHTKIKAESFVAMNMARTGNKMHDSSRATLEITSGMRNYCLQEMILPIHDAIVCGVKATFGDTFSGGEQQVWFAVLAICWRSNMILNLRSSFN